MATKNCPKCGGKMFLVYGSGYKGNKYDFNCMSCGYTENAGDTLPDKPKITFRGAK